ncbi:hypothetical protein [Archangium lansingense]|uniref:Uncharacterized protein n=1 Tax=Archangium lansingense TaxID=2995310 RepID=A0ABT4A9H9_9BACT|nr:hypothetical protein [Archangium lansinium]MCY1077602.1 hypothetical protein [Archangium lansinium]
MRRGAGHFYQRSVPLPVNRLAQFVHGLCLPFHLVRTLWEDRRLRRRHLAVSLLQAVVILGLAVLLTDSGTGVVETVGPEEWMVQQQEEAEARGERERELEEVAEGAGKLAGMAGSDGEKVRVAVEQALKEAHKAEELQRAARETAGKELEHPEKKRSFHPMVYLVALLSSLQLAQWIVIALSRDFHTELSREVSLRSGVAPEDEPITPRVRLNVPWVRSKMRRRWRALVVFACGVPVLWLFTRFLPWRDSILATLMSLWGAWWFVVFTAGKSALAWNEQAPREPWFLRGWNELTRRWAMFGVYSSMWTKHTREVFSPVASVERRPWGLMGLAVVRALAALPLVKCFLRPVIPVAAAHLLAADAPASLLKDSSVPGDA